MYRIPVLFQESAGDGIVRFRGAFFAHDALLKPYPARRYSATIFYG